MVRVPCVDGLVHLTGIKPSPLPISSVLIVLLFSVNAKLVTVVGIVTDEVVVLQVVPTFSSRILGALQASNSSKVPVPAVWVM